MTPRDILDFLLLPISRSPNLPLYHFGDSSMYSGHSKLIKVLDRYPFPSSFSINSLAGENMKSKFEVSKGLLESSDRLLDFNVDSHFFFDIVS